MAETQLTATPRELSGKKVRFLRRQGLLPGNVYGQGQPSVAVQVPEHDLHDMVRHGVGKHYFDLVIEGSKGQPVVIQDIQVDPVSRHLLHVDFLRVSLTEPITVTIPLTFTGESPASREGGVVTHALNSLSISALPGDVPEQIEVDLTLLPEIDSALHVSDLRLPPNVQMLTDATQLIAKVEAPRVEAEEVVAEAEAAEAAEEAEAAEAAEE